MSIPFDTNPALRDEITRVAKELTRQRVAQLKTGDPHKEPPVIPPLLLCANYPTVQLPINSFIVPLQ